MFGKFLGKIAKATGAFDPQDVKKRFITQIDHWAPYDFIQYCCDKEGGSTWDPKEGTKKPCPEGWKSKYFLDEDQACKFVKHLITKWKARNRNIIDKHKGKLETFVYLDEFGGHLKDALKGNEFTAPFTDKNYPLKGDWYRIFGVLEYDEATCRSLFKKMCDDNGRLYYGTLESKIVNPLAGSIVVAVDRLIG